MSSLFNKTTGISLASVLSGTNGNSSSNSLSKLNKLNNNVLNQSKYQTNSSINSTDLNNSSIVSNTNHTSGSSQTQQNVNNNKSAKPLNNYLKTIDNCLEEATRTGDLLLSNKSLIEFPSTIAFKYDLTDTLTVDLSKNRLSELPKEILRFKPLEKLILNSNIIRIIPDINVNQLKCIKILDLNCNRLTYLPPSICNLVSLEILTVNNNKLVSLPEEIGRLEKLIQLDVSCNEITHLPVQIGDMVLLRSLNVRRNLLVELPKEISQLKLVSFDCTSNRISKLPLCFREMVTLIDLIVDNNPLEVPPAHICTKGLLHIMKYLLVEAIKEEKKRGVLTEYEINSQFSSNSNTTNQRSSCNSSNGIGSIGSFLFQSSVRNMCKKFSDSSSTTSTTESTSSSVSSASQLSLKHPKQSISNLQNNNLVSKSINSISSASSNSSTSSSAPIKNPPIITQSFSNNNSKQNLYLNNENVDYSDQSPQSLTSSPSSSSSSSPPILLPPQEHSKNIITASSKSGSIHELLSLKSPTQVVNNNSNMTTLQQQQLNYLKYNRNGSSSDNLSIDHGKQEQDHHIWRMTEARDTARKMQEEQSLISKTKHRLLLEQQQQQFDANFSIVAGLSSCSSILSPSSNSLISATNNNSKPLIENKLNNRRLTNEYNSYEINSSQKISSSMMQIHTATMHSSKNSSISTPIPVMHQQQIPNEPDQLIYDESLNPIVIQTNSYSSSFSANSFIQKIEPIADSSSQDDRFYHQQQQVWVPRNDISSNDMNTYNQHHFSPVQQTTSKQESADLKNLNPAFTIRRHFLQIEQEQKQIETLRKAIESKLKIQLPVTTTVEELGASLSDGVVLCHLMNQVYPRAIQMIHVPSLSMPKLSLAKCRKNVENFIDACRRIGLDENDMCCAHDIIEGKNITKIARTVIVLVNLNQHIEQKNSSSQPIYEYRPQTIGNVMSNNGSSLQIQPHQQQTAV